MKTKVLTFILFLLPVVLYAQPDSSKFNIRFNGGYADVGLSNGAASLGAVSSANRQWEISLAVGYVIDRHWEMGLGFSYQKQKTQAVSTIYLPFQDRQWIGVENTETDVHLTTFDIYTAGYWRLFSRLYFAPKLTLSIGGAKGTRSNFIVSRQMSNSESPELIESGITPMSSGTDTDISYDYGALQVAPAFTFYINKHFALNLEVGSFQFSTIDWEWDNKQWEATVNPAYWRLGLIFAF